MTTMKKGLVLVLVLAMVFSLAACGSKLEKSELTGAEVMDEFWNLDLDASAEKLNGYRAQSVEEVVANWRQAKMQGNGAILYALYSPDQREVYLHQMKITYGCWNFYLSPAIGGTDTTIMPLDILMSAPEAIEDKDDEYAVTVTAIMKDGTTEMYDIYIALVDGGYFVTSETAPETIGVE